MELNSLKFSVQLGRLFIFNIGELYTLGHASIDIVPFRHEQRNEAK